MAGIIAVGRRIRIGRDSPIPWRQQSLVLLLIGNQGKIVYFYRLCGLYRLYVVPQRRTGSLFISFSSHFTIVTIFPAGFAEAI
jgi:hypothetical protein